MKLLLKLIFGLVLAATSYAQTGLETLKVFKTAADNNLKILQILKQENLNCCDYRNEPRCNEIMKPTKETGGIEVIKSEFPTDKTTVFIVPLAYKEKPDGVSLTAVGLVKGMHFQIIERDFMTQEGKLLWVGMDTRKYAATFSRTNLSVADANRPQDVSASPSVCYLQTLLPDASELVTQDLANDIWCVDSGTEASNVAVGGLQLCVKNVKCRTNEMKGASLEYAAGCKRIVVEKEWDCPPATYCAGDQSVSITGSRVKLTGESGFSKMNTKPSKEEPASPREVK